MISAIFCDYKGTLDCDDSQILLDTLKEMKKAGVKMFLATDADEDEAQGYRDDLIKAGYNLFNGVISAIELGFRKKSDAYWPQVTEEYGINIHEVIFLDDSSKNLEQARKNGVNAISSIKRERAAEELKTIYARLCHQ